VDVELEDLLGVPSLLPSQSLKIEVRLPPSHVRRTSIGSITSRKRVAACSACLVQAGSGRGIYPSA
jgi:hypothetical protein